MAETTITTKDRPGLITFVGILTIIKAVGALLVAALFFLALASDTIADSLGTSDTTVLIVGGVMELIFAVIIGFIASGVMKGAPWARIWLTIVFSIRLAAAGILGVNSAFNENFTGFAYPLLAIILPIVVLYVMWGNERGDAFFSKK